MDNHPRLLEFIAADVDRIARAQLAVEVGCRGCRAVQIGRAGIDQQAALGGTVVTYRVCGEGRRVDHDEIRNVDVRIQTRSARRSAMIDLGVRIAWYVAVPLAVVPVDYSVEEMLVVVPCPAAVFAVAHNRAVVEIRRGVEQDAAALATLDKAVLHACARVVDAKASAVIRTGRTSDETAARHGGSGHDMDVGAKPIVRRAVDMSARDEAVSKQRGPSVQIDVSASNV